MRRRQGRPKAYFAAPLFNPMERAFNLDIARKIEAFAEVFLPQRDGGLIMELIKSGMRSDRAAKEVFGADVKAMRDADLMVAILDGAKIDEGVAFEIGFMYGLGKDCIGLQTDLRRALPTGNNPMIEASLNAICHDEQEFIRTVERYSRKHCVAYESHSVVGEISAPAAIDGIRTLQSDWK